MLTTETKKKIDNLRDTLVGKIPVPSEQIELITLGLIYKFMSDIDEQNLELGAKDSFFNGKYKQYAWSRIIDRSLSGQERTIRFAEGLESMANNPNLPQLFRDIFKGAYLPFKDPVVLDHFLKGINELTYTHSEELGNAFEYLLSAMGSQGDAGQFRTPRHIIDFIVKAVDPKKGETILDPACGTAGFLISAYKYILHQNTKEDGHPGSSLSSDDRKKLTSNFHGYDISHDMVRLSLANLYLHNFPQPKIIEYDALSDDARWNDTFDCILANPPFMTPRGGIRPHGRFMVQASKSEVLFVDYILEHLNQSGHAGIVVPEGIVFQTSNAYVQLRKLLIEKGLYCVISLPVGVFNPYTKTTKTSILLVDKTVQRKIGGVAFLKVENDGYDLGAERYEIAEDDLPEALDIITKLKKAKSVEQSHIFHGVMSIEEITARDNCNLSILNDVDEDLESAYTNIEIGQILKQKKQTISLDDKKEYKQITVKMNGKGAVLRGLKKGSEIKTKRQFVANTGDFIMSKIDARNGAFAIVPSDLDGAIVTQDFPLFAVNESVMIPDFLNIMMQSPQFIKICQKTSIGTSNRRRIKVENFLSSKVPLPDLKTQKKIVSDLELLNTEIEDYQEKIDQSQEKIDKKISEVWGDKE